MPAETPESSAASSCDFFGRVRLKLDEKGRVTLPSLYRKCLPEGTDAEFVLRPSPREPAVQMIPLHEWRALRARREEVGKAGGRPAGPTLQWQQRRLYGSVDLASLDPKGRFTAPRELLAHCGIKDELLVLGVGRILELWDPDRYFALEAEHAADMADVDDLLYR